MTGIRGYVESVGGEFPADRWGKIKMVVQCIAVGVILWTDSFEWSEGWRAFWLGGARVFVAATLLTTVGSGLGYVLKTRGILDKAER